MTTGEPPHELDLLQIGLQEVIAPFVGKVEYGNLRSKISEWDCGDGEPVTNVALVYETPGGSTDQINITYYRNTGLFSLVDEKEGERTTRSVEQVLERVGNRVRLIPERRRETLYAEIRRQIDSGSNTAGLFGHLNRLMQSEFKGGRITHLELRDAMTYAVQYMKQRTGGYPAASL